MKSEIFHSSSWRTLSNLSMLEPTIDITDEEISEFSLDFRAKLTDLFRWRRDVRRFRSNSVTDKKYIICCNWNRWPRLLVTASRGALLRLKIQSRRNL